MKPYIFLNLKTYEQATGENALNLAKIAQKVAAEGKADIIVIAQAVDIRLLVDETKVLVFAQHADLESYGAHTGKVTLEAIKQAGAAGVMINHSEDRMDMDSIKKMAKRCKELEIPMLVCVANLEEAKTVTKLKPEYIAYEDPELIGSGKAITKQNPDGVMKFAELVKGKTISLCGAGISSGIDFVKALEMGCNGVLLASAFTKAEDPEEMLMKFAGVK